MSRSRVLVVDDDLAIRVLVSILLEAAGYEPVAVPSVERALERLDGEHVDLVLTDLQMPGAGGLELLDCLRLGGSRVPAIVMTGSDDDELLDAALRRGAATVLQKPFSPEALRAAVDGCLAATPAVQPAA
jgi:two-component system response regulator MtrA